MPDFYLETFLPKSGHQVAVDVVRDFLQEISLSLGVISVPFLVAILVPVYSLFGDCALSLTLPLSLLLIIVILCSPDI